MTRPIDETVESAGDPTANFTEPAAKPGPLRAEGTVSLADDPGDRTPTASLSDDLGDRAPTASLADDPGDRAPTMSVSDDPGDRAPTASLADDPGANAPTASLGASPRTPAIRSVRDLPVVQRAHYEILSEYARGGLGRILRARDRRTGRIVAIKEMLGHNDDVARRFAREALITANLQHPAIVPVYELGRWPSNEPFYAMKLVAGRSFAQAILDCKTLDDRLAHLPILVSVADALAYAHGQRIIHRDLKPANVLVGNLGETVVIDWGLAKLIDEADISGDGGERLVLPDVAPLHTVAGKVMGTPAYMPPEQARGDAADERADVYAIGAMLYHLISGRTPYSDLKLKSGKEMVRVVRQEPPTALTVCEPGAPSELVTIVDKAMARVPADRYANAGELSDDLRRFTTGQLVGAHHYDRRTLFARWLKRNRAPVTVGGVLALVLAAFAVWSVARIVAESDKVKHERDNVQHERDIAVQQTARAEEELATALYEKGVVAEGRQEWGRAAMYYAAARHHRDSPASAWAAGLAEARAVIPVARHVGHTALVHAVAISPDGERVASVDDVGQLRVWAPSDGHLIAARALSTKALYAIAFAPDGHELAVAGDDGAIWRVGLDLAPIATLTGHAGRIWSLAYSPDGKLLASGGEDTTVRLWPIAGGAPQVLAGHTQRVYSVAFSPDGERVASGGDDRRLWVWSVATGKGAQRGLHKAGGIRVVAFTPSGDEMITTGWDHEIRVWKGSEPVLGDAWDDGGVVYAGAVMGGVFVTGGEMSAIHAWDVSTHQLITSLDTPTGTTTTLAFSRDGRWLVSAGKAEPIVWDATAFRRLVAVGHGGEVPGLAFSRDGTRLATGATDHTVRLWDLATTRELRRVPTGSLVCGDGVLVLGDDELASTCDDATLRRWDAAGHERTLATGVWLRVTSLSPDGTTIAAGHDRGRLALVDVASWTITSQKTAHQHHIYGVQYARDGRLVTASLDDHVRTWRGLELDLDVKVGTDDGSLAAALSPDGALLAIGTQEGSLELWDTKTQRWRIRDVGAGKLGTVWKLVYGPDNARVFTASADGKVRSWNTTTWTADVLDAGEGATVGLAVAPDGKTLAAGYESGAVVLWDVSTKQVKARIGGRTRERGSCADVATQAWVDGAHRAIVAAACSTDARTYFDRLAARTHQHLVGEVDVTWDW